MLGALTCQLAQGIGEEKLGYVLDRDAKRNGEGGEQESQNKQLKEKGEGGIE